MDTGGIGGAGRRIFGVVCGVVVNNHHPTGEYRVKVKFPWIRSTDVGDEEDFISAWARVATPFAGGGRGFYCLPEHDDEVLVMFEHGDLRRPYVIGSLWNGQDPPPVNLHSASGSTDPMGLPLGIRGACTDNGDITKTNKARFLTSRSGHLLLFDDGDLAGSEKVVIKTTRGHVLVLNDKRGHESIALYDSSGEEYLHFDEVRQKITLESRNGDIDILCRNGRLNIEAQEINTFASSTATHEATTSMRHSSTEVAIEGSASVDVKGGRIDLN